MLDCLSVSPVLQLKRLGDVQLLYIVRAIKQMSGIEDAAERQHLEQAAWDQIPEWLGPMLDPEVVTMQFLLQHQEHDRVLRWEENKPQYCDAVFGVIPYHQQVITGGFVADCPLLLLTCDIGNGVAIGCAHIGSPELFAGLHSMFLSEWRKLVGHGETCGYISRHIAVKDYEWRESLPVEYSNLERWRRRIDGRMCFDLLGALLDSLMQAGVNESVYGDLNNSFALAQRGLACSHRAQGKEAGRDFAGFIIQT